MNANLLTKLIECDSWYKLVTREEIANTLRQQAKRIEELEIELAKKTELERRKSELINSLIKNIVDACNDALRIASRD